MTGSGSSLISWIFFFTPRKISQEGGYLIGDMEDRVIFDFMDEIFYPKEDTRKVSC